MAAYYNEFEPYAAQWLRNLIAAGHLPAGDVDERSIIDVRPDDLKGYIQCHFFAGIGGWGHALRLAGWPDDRPVWTGSCPCQPFSSAGKQEGHADERHLWPHWFRLIRERRPRTVFGEQVAGAIAFGWLDEVFNDLEAEAYTCAATVLPACSVGAPHKRDRLWFVANSYKAGKCRGLGQETGSAREGEEEMGLKIGQRVRIFGGGDGSMGDAEHNGRDRGQVAGSDQKAILHDEKGAHGTGESSGASEPSDVADANGGQHIGEITRSDQRAVSGGYGKVYVENSQSIGRGEGRLESTGQQGRSGAGGTGTSRIVMDNAEFSGLEGQPGDVESSGGGQSEDGSASTPNPNWIDCPDGKARPVKPGLRLLVDGAARGMDNIRAIEKRIAEEMIAYGASREINPREVLPMVRQYLQTQKNREKEEHAGMCKQFHAQEILLSFLFCIESTFNSSITASIEETRKEIHEKILRKLRYNNGIVCASCGWESLKQYAEKSTDPMHVLSFILASNVKAYREAIRDAHAAFSRVSMLKGFGNAIVPQVAAEFIKAAEGLIS